MKDLSIFKNRGRKALEIAQIAIAGSKIVNRNGYAQRFKRAQLLQ